MLDDYLQGKTNPLYSDPIFDMKEGPLWNYNFADKPEEEICEELEKTLKITGVSYGFIFNY